MSALLTDNLPLLAGAPNGIQKLRELILELAVRGKLVPQDPSDEPASELLKRIAEEKARLVAEGKIRKQKSLGEIGGGEKSFGLPAGWAWQRFADFALDVSTGPFGSLIHQSDYVDDGVPLVNPSHMIDGRIVADQAVSLSIEMAASLASYRLSAGDMVMARRGEVGRVALVTEAEDGWLCGTGSFVLRFTPEVSREYVWTLFRCNSVRTYLAGAAVGTTMVNLNHGILLKMPIAVPPLAEQHRIVTKVDELMALCDRLEARQADAASAHARLVQALLDSLTQASDAADFAASWQRLAEHFHSLFSSESSIDALKQTLLQLAVMGKLVPQDSNDEPASELFSRMQAERKSLVAAKALRQGKPLPEIEQEEMPFDLPRNWTWVRLGQIGDWGAGATPARGNPSYYGGEMPWFKSGELVSDLISRSEESVTELALKECSLRRNKAGDVLIAMYGATIGKTAILAVPATTNQAVCACTPFNGLFNRYLLLTLKAMKSHFIGQGAGGAQPNISREKIIAAVTGLPPEAEQHRIVAKLDELFALCDQLKSRVTSARHLHEQLAGGLVEQAVA